jgi:alpha-1,6-mannosyltransferase
MLAAPEGATDMGSSGMTWKMTSGMIPSARPERRAMMVARRISLAGIVSALLYAAVYALQRAMSPLHAGQHLYLVAALYVATTVALFAGYASVVAIVRRPVRSSSATAAAFLFPVLFSLALMCGRPYLSIDELTYVAQGHQAIAGANPYQQEVRDVAGTPYGAALVREGWLPVHGVSPYGPLWTELEIAVDRLTTNVRNEVLLLKIAVTAFTFGCAWLIWLVLGRTSPDRQLFGTVLFLWNPVIVMELAGEGHNDSVMMFFVLLSLLCWMKRRHAAGVMALGIGALLKIVAPMIAPLELAQAWREERTRRRLLATIASGTCVVAIVAIAAYAPLWIGPATLNGIRDHSRPGVYPSTQGVLYWQLTRSHSEELSGEAVSVALTGGFLFSVIVVATSVRDTRTLLRGCAAVSIAYLALAPGYWPWYAVMPIALIALTPSPPFLWALGAISLGSRLAAPIDVLRIDGLMDWPQEVVLATVVGVWLPIGAVAIAVVWRRTTQWKQHQANDLARQGSTWHARESC